MENVKTWLPKLLLIIAAGIVALSLYNVVKIFLQNSSPLTTIEQNLNLNNSDVTPNSDASVVYTVDNLSGYLYFDSIPILREGDNTSNPGITPYAYDLVDETYAPVFNFYGNHYDLTPLSNTKAAFLSVSKNDEDAPVTLPVTFDMQTGELAQLSKTDGAIPTGIVVSGDNPERIITSFRKEDVDKAMIDSHWFVFYNPYTGTNVILDKSSSPAWANSGEDVYFLKQDGIYRYNLASDKAALAYHKYSNFDALNELTIAQNNGFALLTRPSIRALMTFELDPNTGNLKEKSFIVTPGTTYKSPVIAPNSQHYAIVAHSKANTLIEFRHYRSSKVIHTITIPDVAQDRLTLSAWKNYLLTQLPKDI